MDDPWIIETQGHCFVCLVKLEPESEGLLPYSYSFHPLQHLCSYLKVDLLEKVYNSDGGDGGEIRSTRLVQVPLCEGCQPLNGSLSELYIQLQKIKGQMASYLEQLHRKMTSADETGLGELFRTLMGGDNIVEKLRKETILKCSHKLTAFLPQVDLRKLSRKELKVQKGMTTRGRPRSSKLPCTVINKLVPPSNVKMEPEAVLPDSDDEDCLPEPGRLPSEDDEASNNNDDRVLKASNLGGSSLLQNSTLIPKTAGRRRCNFCLEEFTSGPGFTYHYRKVHLQLKFKCDVCGREFSSRGDFNRHYNNLHVGVKFQCQICAKIFSLKTNLRLHQRLKQCSRGRGNKNAQLKPSSKVKSIPKKVKRGRGRPKKVTEEQEEESDEYQSLLPSDSEAVEDHSNSKTARVKHEDEEKPEVIIGKEALAIMAPSSQELEVPAESILRRGRSSKLRRVRPRKAVMKESDSDSEEAVVEDPETEPAPTLSPQSILNPQASEPKARLKQRFKCNSCDKTFSYRQSYTKHYRNCSDRNRNEEKDDKDADYFPEPTAHHSPSEDQDASNQEGLQKVMESQFTIVGGQGSDKVSNKSLLQNSSTPISEEGGRRCNDCSEEFSSASLFTSHYRRVHLKLRVKCNVCGDHFTDNGTFYRHYRNIHLGLKFRCSTCSKLFSLKYDLRKHQREKCSSRGEEEEQKVKPKRRRRGKKAIPQSASSVPLEIVVAPQPQVEHPEAAEINREEVEITVGDLEPQTTRAIPPPTILQEGGAAAGPVESVLNPETGRYGCLLCSKEFKLERVFQDHYKSIHLKLRYKCAACPKSFGYPQAYASHYRHVHVRINYKCRVCGAKFLRRAGLWKHQQQCRQPYGHQCPQCGKGFLSGIKLRTHIKAIHVKQHHICDRCGKEFNTAHYLNRHIKKMHPAEGERRQLDCPHCDKQFPSPYNLKLHFRTHTGEKPYQCEHCGKAFASGSNRKVHERSCTRGGQQQQQQTNTNMFNFN